VSSGSPCPVSVVWDDRFLDYAFGPDHPFSERSRWLAVRLLQASDLLTTSGSRLVAPGGVAADPDLRRFHAAEYLERVRAAGAAARPPLLDRGDTPGFPGCHDAAARLVEGTLVGLRAVLDSAGTHAFQPGGGLHHAHPSRASGFCIYNDLAVALRTALDGPARLRRVAYVDIDAHHGDGVMYGFYDDGRVLDIDFHQDGRTLFPGTGSVTETGAGDGAGLKVNVPLPPTAGDEAFLPLFDRIVPPMLREFRPELIVLQTGVDGHAGDPLAGLQYTWTSYAHAVATLHDLSHELCGGRFLETGGGGYSPESVALTLARAATLISGTPVPPPETATPANWRAEFAEWTGTTAPARWEDRQREVASAWRPDREDRLVAALSQALGRRF